ncbi:YidB family protein [Kluyvera intermedia]|uniref:YidB family protein n=1 Tax=Kluyvera intermedia TaxID=61648 RepID=UPI003BA11A4B
MGFFDDVVGSLLQGDSGKYQAILTWVNDQGGVQALLEKLKNGGLGDIVSSWISNQHNNQSVSADQIESALGTPAVADLGAKLGTDASSASSLLADYLPRIIDALSPKGEVDSQAHSDLISAGMNLLKGGKPFG